MKEFQRTFDSGFYDILDEIMTEGDEKPTRCDGVSAKSVFNRILVCEDSSGYEGFPLSKLRKIHYKGAIIEMLWLLGLHMKDERYKDLPITNIQYLQDHNVNYWNPWADESGNLGPVYGKQLVSWTQKKVVQDAMEGNEYVIYNHINQIQEIINRIRKNPDDRRLVANMWNPADLEKMALPPCHYCVEFYSRIENGKRVLDTRWIQRSCDMIVGIPYNAMMYTILNKIVALCTGHIPGIVSGCLGNCHVYSNQYEAATEILRRFRHDFQDEVNMPRLKISDRIMNKALNGVMCELSDFAIDGSDFKVENYEPLPALKVAVNV